MHIQIGRFFWTLNRNKYRTMIYAVLFQSKQNAELDNKIPGRIPAKGTLRNVPTFKLTFRLFCHYSCIIFGGTNQKYPL